MENINNLTLAIYFLVFLITALSAGIIIALTTKALFFLIKLSRKANYEDGIVLGLILGLILKFLWGPIIFVIAISVGFMVGFSLMIYLLKKDSKK